MKVIPLDKSALEEGIKLFNRGEYFDAHEAWDSLWLRAEDAQVKRFLQGLIMAAGALHLAKKGGCSGAVTLLAKSIPLLKSGVEAQPELKLSDFLQTLERLSRDRQWCSTGEIAHPLPMIKIENVCCGPRAGR